jgi:ribonuclease G
MSHSRSGQVTTPMKEILVHVGRRTIETAVLADGQLVEYDMEEAAGGKLAGNLYLGRVENVLPGMQAAFVNIGLARNAFLYIDDVLHPHLEKQPKKKPSITELLRPGQELIVQIVKEPQGGKGARVTTHYTLPGRYLVYMPHADYVAVSRKVADDRERERLKEAGERIRQGEEGLILRTAAEGETLERLTEDVEQLRERWNAIRAKAAVSSAPCELHRDDGLMLRLVRDMLDAGTDRIWVDDEAAFGELRELVGRMAPAKLECVSLYDSRETGLFERRGVRAQLEQAFGREIRLPSGGSLVWDQTEALTIIDVNTGKYVGSTGLEETVFATNLEAAGEITRLLRLRDTGGIVLIDFIDMEDETHRAKVEERLAELARRDRTACHVLGWTRLGLMEMTRKKVRQDAALRLYEPCPACGGRGVIAAGPGEGRRRDGG